MIFDTHAHYDDERFSEDRDALLRNVLPKAGVVGIINMASDYNSLAKTAALAREYSYVYGAVGIHPECAKELPDSWLDDIKQLAAEEKLIAIGEIGLDYHWLDECPKERQQEVFAAQLELANELSMPVAVHDREAHADTLAFLKKYRPRGVVHCFSGSWEMAQELLKLGLYLGIGGVVTFKNARHAVEVAEKIPLDRLLLETDAPYMAPVPCRGQRNDSSLIAHVAEKIAELRGMTADEILAITRNNTKSLFGI